MIGKKGLKGLKGKWKKSGDVLLFVEAMSRGEKELLCDQRGPAKMNPFIVVAKESNAGDPRPESDWIELRMVLSSRDKVGVRNIGFPANGFSWKKIARLWHQWPML